MNKKPILQESLVKLREIIKENELFDVMVSVKAIPLTPEEAIGNPERRDYPIIEGKERVIEANVLGSKGHAFTDIPQEFNGTLKDVLELSFTSNQNRAVYVATLNAVLRHLGIVEGTVHCKDEDPEKCAKEIASYLFEKFGKVKIGLIGLNPAIAEMLINTFGVGNVKITDLNKQNISFLKYGVKIWDGRDMTQELIKQSDVILITGTTLVNDTFDFIWECIHNYNKDYIIYGVTVAGIGKLMGLNRICPYGRN